MKLRFGLADGFQYTLDDVGYILGLSCERIRQLESRAVNKLRDERIRRQLTDFVD